jgi:hypothetical protein
MAMANRSFIVHLSTGIAGLTRNIACDKRTELLLGLFFDAMPRGRWPLCPEVQENSSLISLMALEQWVELNPCHIGLGYVRNVTPCTLCHGFFCSYRITGLRVMAEGKETPPIRFGEPLAVLYRYVHAVKCSVEKASSGRLRTRTIRESWIKNPS